MTFRNWTFGLIFVLLICLPASGEVQIKNSEFVILLPINVNTANALILQRALVGIGPKKAQRIVEYRENNGEFASIQELVHVKGIGPGTIERNLGRISIE